MFSGLGLLNTFDSKEGKGSFVLGKITVLKPVPAMTQTAGFPDSVNGVPLHRQLDPLPCTLCTLGHLHTVRSAHLQTVHTCTLHCAHLLTCSLAQITADQRHHCWSPVLAAGALSWNCRALAAITRDPQPDC